MYSIDEVVSLDLRILSITVVEAITIRKESCRVILLNVVIWAIVYIIINTTLGLIILIDHSMSLYRYYCKSSRTLSREKYSIDLISDTSWVPRIILSIIRRSSLGIQISTLESVRHRKYIEIW